MDRNTTVSMRQVRVLASTVKNPAIKDAVHVSAHVQTPVQICIQEPGHALIGQLPLLGDGVVCAVLPDVV